MILGEGGLMILGEGGLWHTKFPGVGGQDKGAAIVIAFICCINVSGCMCNEFQMYIFNIIVPSVSKFIRGFWTHLCMYVLYLTE